MTKRLKKKHNRSIITLENIVGDNDIQTPTFVYIKKKYWNKGNRDNGCITNDNGDYISVEYANKRRFKYIVAVNNCLYLTITILKSWDNKNHIIFKS